MGDINLLPLCLSCAYFALLIGLLGTSYLKSPALGASVLLPFALIVVAFALGVWTFYPKLRKPENTIKKRSVRPEPKNDRGGDKTMIE